MPWWDLSEGRTGVSRMRSAAGAALPSAPALSAGLSPLSGLLSADFAAAMKAPGTGAPGGATPKAAVSECWRKSGFGRRTAPVPSIVVTTSPPSAQTGRRHELMARCSAWFLDPFHLDRITVQEPQPPCPHAFLGPASPTRGDRK